MQLVGVPISVGRRRLAQCAAMWPGLHDRDGCCWFTFI